VTLWIVAAVDNLLARDAGKQWTHRQDMCNVSQWYCTTSGFVSGTAGGALQRMLM